MTQIDNDQLEAGKPEPRRDQYQRAMLVGPTGTRVPYTRVSTIAKALDDQSTLINYNQRLTAVGLTRRKDLHDVVAMMKDPEGDDKSELRKIVEDAANAGGQGYKANLGTARHKASERIDAGESPTSFAMPDDIKRDIDAYLTEMDRVGLRPLPQYCETHGLIEGFDYNSLGVSGTFDKALGDGSDIFCGDMKTGQEVKYAMLAWAIQLGIYANFEVRYDIRTDTRHPMPNLRKDIGFIIWLPAGQGRCRIIEIDLANGFKYAQLAVGVRGARAHGKVDLGRDGALVRYYEPAIPVAVPVPSEPVVASTPVDGFMCIRGTLPDGTIGNLVGILPADGNAPPVPAIAPTDTETKRRDWLKQRLRDMPEHGRNLVAHYWSQWNDRAQNPIPGLNSDHQHGAYELGVIEQWVNDAESECQHDLSADPTVVAAKAIHKAFPGTIDEGTAIEEAQLVTLSANLALWCQPKHLHMLQEWREEAIRLGRDFGIKECPTTRRLALYELGANLCNMCEGDQQAIDVAWATLTTALGWTAVPDIPFGLAFSMLSIEDIEKCMAVVVQTPMLALHYDANTGCPTWGPVPTS